MKKVTTSLIALALLSFNASAFEWGGKFNNQTTFEGEKFSELKLVQNDSLALWATTPLSKDNSCNFASEIFYGIKHSESEDTFDNIVDVNLLRISKAFSLNNNGTILLSAGRFGYNDLTGLILSQKIDGVLLDYTNKDLSISGFGGFTGLLNTHTTTIISKRVISEEKDFYSTCEKYIPFGFKFTYKALSGSNNISLQGLGFKDLEDDPIDRFYGTVGANGFIIPKLSYNLSTTFGTEDFDNLTNLSVMNVSAFINDKAMISLNGTYASGDKAAFKPFIGFTSQSAYDSIYSPEYFDLFKAEVTGNYMLTEEGIISAATGLVFDGEFKYKGFQWKIGSQFNILNDLKLGASIGQFYSDNSDENKTNISLNVSLNF